MKANIALFFTILFVGIIITPTVITLVYKNQDVTIFLEINEEEESKGQKALKNLDFKVYAADFNTSIFFNNIQKKKNVRFNSKNYVSQYAKILTPPPELV